MDLIFRSSFDIPACAQDLYTWHARPGAFERLLPPWESVKALTPSSIESDAILRLPGGLRWHLTHEPLVGGLGFLDKQTKGPFKSWTHLHEFQSRGPQLCAVKDRIVAELPIALPYLRSQLERRLQALTAYRSRILTADFEFKEHLKTPLPQGRILLTGSNGLVGRALKAFLTTQGCTVIPLSLRLGGEQAAAALIRKDGPFEAVIHLSGEPILQKWTPEAMERIRSSRVALTRWLVRALCKQEPFTPPIFISASATGYYGTHPGCIATEESPASSSSFLGQVAQAWEEATKPLLFAGTRVACLRMGVVMSPAGGFLKTLLPLFRCYLGGMIDKGLHRLSWISIDDLLYLIAHILTDKRYSGPVNAVAPQVINHKAVALALGAQLKKPAGLHIPPKVLSFFKGEALVEEVLLSDTPSAPQKALDLGFEFRYPTLPQALAHLLPRA